MIHDTALVIGFMGFWRTSSTSTPRGRKVLMIEPVPRQPDRSSPPYSTVMSYSMIDTIVGLRTACARTAANSATSHAASSTDSINQTLSRTFLTGSTNIMTVFVMYVLGGPASMALLSCSLLAYWFGTYSSVAIAAPLLSGRRGYK